jgi:hypothetical protein
VARYLFRHGLEVTGRPSAQIQGVRRRSGIDPPGRQAFTISDVSFGSDNPFSLCSAAIQPSVKTPLARDLDYCGQRASEPSSQLLTTPFWPLTDLVTNRQPGIPTFDGIGRRVCNRPILCRFGWAMT